MQKISRSAFFVFTVFFSLFFSVIVFAFDNAKYEPPDGKIYHFTRITSQADFAGDWFQDQYKRYMNIVDGKKLAGFHSITYWCDYGGCNKDNYDKCPLDKRLGPEHYPRYQKFLEKADGIIMSWLPGDMNNNGTEFCIDITEIDNGEWDDYIRSWAVFFRDLDAPIWIDLFPESNGGWFPWSMYYYKGPRHWNQIEFRRAFRHVQQIFEEEGATNVAWVWRPAVNVDPNSVNYEKFYEDYPGDEEVDWIGLAHYNFIDVSYSDPFIAFAEAHNKPVMYTEFATSLKGVKHGYWEDSETHKREGYPYYPGDVKWTDGMLQKAEDTDRIKLISWFNSAYTCDNNREECTWIDRNSEQIEVFREHILRESFISNIYASGECIEDWVCSDWGSCFDNVQFRVCVDEANCGTTLNKPETTKSCRCVNDSDCLLNETCYIGKCVKSEEVDATRLDFLSQGFVIIVEALLIVFLLLFLFGFLNRFIHR